MNKIRLFTLAVLTAVLMLDNGVGAQPPEDPGEGPGMARCQVPCGQGRMGPGMRGGMSDKVVFYLAQSDRLGLSKEQVAQLRDLKFAFEKASVERHASLQTTMIELQQSRSAESVDAKKVEAQIREVFSRRAEIAVAAFKAQDEADKVLTDEQRTLAKSPWKGDRMERPCRANRPGKPKR